MGKFFPELSYHRSLRNVSIHQYLQSSNSACGAWLRPLYDHSPVCHVSLSQGIDIKTKINHNQTPISLLLQQELSFPANKLTATYNIFTTINLTSTNIHVLNLQLSSTNDLCSHSGQNSHIIFSSTHLDRHCFGSKQHQGNAFSAVIQHSNIKPLFFLCVKVIKLTPCI